jgi:hypothetical protein
VFEAVEAAPPLAAAEAVGAQLAEALGARDVGFLIADVSGRSLVRLGHDGGRETAVAVPLHGSPQGGALETQDVVVESHDAGARVYVPVTTPRARDPAPVAHRRDGPHGRVGAARDDPGRALRNGRRAGVSLAEQARRGHEALVAEAPPAQFVTGQLVRVDLLTGRAEIVNAGHPPPLRLRDGAVSEVKLVPELPFGTLRAAEHCVQDLPLEPGDRLVFLTDGMFGTATDAKGVAPTVADTAGLHPREAVQHLTRVARADRGGELRDDATVLVLDWHGGPERGRASRSGADR